MNNDLEQFSEETLHGLISGEYFPSTHAAQALARIALAAKRAEPVAYGTLQKEFCDEERSLFTDKDSASKYSESCYDLTPLYTTPQLNSPEMLEGWKLVPIEITKAMRDAWDSAPNGHEDDDVNMCNAYRAMIAAAPEPQTQQQNIPEIIPQGWTSSDPANAALVMLDRIDTIDSADDDRIEDIKLIIRQLAAAPESE
ncbi:hypothetical protein NUA08_004329 [Yersinia enterocolitica]|nr:hypothetical protein [Yersinia enterocolitica]